MPTKSEKEFLIRVRADIKQALKDLKQVTGEVGRTGGTAAKSARGVQSLGRAYTLLRNAAGAYLSLRVLKQAVELADAYSVLQTRIRTAVRATGNYVGVSHELFEISRRNGVALQDTVSVFQSLQRSAAELGASTDDVLALTRTVQQLGVIGGSTQAQLGAGLLQFSQGLAGGIFRAEEFNSIVENIPEVAVRIAQGLGLTVGQLRKMVIEGKVASKDVFESLLKQAPAIAEEFEDIPTSVGRASTAMLNSFTRVLGKLGEASGLTDLIVRSMEGVTESLDELAGDHSLEELNAQLERFRALEAKGLGSERFARKRITEIEAQIHEQLRTASQANELNFAYEDAQRKVEELTAREAELAEQVARGGFGKLWTRELSIVRSELQGAKVAADEAAEALANFTPAAAGDRPDAGPELTPEQVRAREQIQKTIEALQLESQVLGLTAAQAQLFKLELAGATDAQLAAAQAALERTEAQRTQFEVMEAGRQVVEATRTDAERLAAEYARLDLLLEQGAIDWDIYARAVFDAEERLGGLADTTETVTSEMSQFAIQAARSMEQAFADEFFDILNGNFDNLGESFTRLLQRMAAELAASQLMKFLLGDFGTTGEVGGLFGGLFPQAMGGVMTARGPLPLKTYAAGGIATRPQLAVFGEGDQPEAFVPLPDGRRIPVALQGGGTGDVRVVIENRGQPIAARDAQATFDPEGMVVRIITDDVDRGGPVSTKFARTFGLNRGGR